MCCTPRVSADKKICPNCGKENPALLKKCVKCKTDLTEVEAIKPNYFEGSRQAELDRAVF